MKLERYVFFLLVLCLTGCTAAYKLPDTSIQLELYPQDRSFRTSDVLVEELHRQNASPNFILLIDETTKSPLKFRNYLKNALNDIGYKQVITESEYLKLLKAKNKQLNSSLDLASLHLAQRELGEFFVFKISVSIVQQQNYAIAIDLIDPVEPKYLFKLRKTITANTTLNGSILYPIANLIYKWSKASTSGTEIKKLRVNQRGRIIYLY